MVCAVGERSSHKHTRENPLKKKNQSFNPASVNSVRRQYAVLLLEEITSTMGKCLLGASLQLL